MCWISANKPIMQEAKKDIPCIKIGMMKGHQIFSMYHFKRYELGLTYNLSDQLSHDIHRGYFTISKGFHSYSENIIFEKRGENNVFIFFKGDNNQSRRFLDGFTINDDIVKLNCIIPKGAKYCLNEQGEYVSDNIKIVSSEQIGFSL